MSSVYMAILNNGWLHRDVMYFMIPRVMKTPGVDVYWEPPHLSWGNPISSNRNNIVRRFLDSDKEFLFMLDHDVVPRFNPMEFVNPKFDVISFPAKVKQSGRVINWNAYLDPPRDRTGSDDIGFIGCDFGAAPNADLCKVQAVGTGAILIKRRVLERIRAPFNCLYDEFGVIKMGTDLAFSKRCGEHGFEIWCTPWHLCEHIKEVGLLDIEGHDTSDFYDNSNEKYNIAWGNWSILQQDWHFLKTIVEEEKIERVLEFGCGLSSLLLSEQCDVTSFETSEKQRDATMDRITPANRLCIKLWDGETADMPGVFDLAFIDGPQGKDSGGIGRTDAVRYAARCCSRIVMHDAWRPHETFLQAKYLRTRGWTLAGRTGCHSQSSQYWKRPKQMKSEGKSEVS